MLSLGLTLPACHCFVHKWNLQTRSKITVLLALGLSVHTLIDQSAAPGPPNPSFRSLHNLPDECVKDLHAMIAVFSREIVFFSL